MEIRIFKRPVLELVFGWVLIRPQTRRPDPGRDWFNEALNIAI
jgi:hypothetical protein